MKFPAASVSLLALRLSLTALVANADDAVCPPTLAERGGPARDGDAAALLSAIESLRAHVLLGPSASPNATDVGFLDAAGIVDAAAAVAANSGQLTSDNGVLTAALGLVDDYEQAPDSYGPMFINTDRFSREYFSRIPLNDDGHEIDRALMIVQQAVMDEAYHASNWGPKDQGSDPVDWPYTPLIGFPACRSLLEGRKWLTAAHMPGMVDPPADSSVEHTVTVDASFPEAWGRPVSMSNPEAGLSRDIRPLGGLYLAPGQIAAVTVPVALAGQGYTIQVGSNVINANRKNLHPRMDRMTTSVPIDEATTYVANPVGGELFLRAPYNTIAGVIDVKVSGGVVDSASFFMTSQKETTEEEWNSKTGELNTNAPAPWVSIESDNYLLNIPRLWMYDYSYNHMRTLLSNYTAIMDAVSTVNGIPPEKRNTYTLYESVSRFGRAGAAGIGYPQCNTGVQGTPSGPRLAGHGGQPGLANVWLLRDPLGQDTSGIRQAMTSHHELGHTSRYRYSCYPGETESINHVGATYARNTVYGDSIDEAFKLSMPGLQNPTAYAPVMSVDRAAVDWMVRENFRAGNPMDTKWETPYKHRGHAKYADMARLFGWDVFQNFYRAEHLLYNELGREPTRAEFCPGFEFDSSSDCRTLRLSIEAGEDLTPFIHFWGVHPQNAGLLKRAMLEHNLYPSRTVKKQLLRYSTIIPKNGTELYDFGDKLWIPDVINRCYSNNCGFYRDASVWWNETHHDDTVDVVIDIISTYWPADGFAVCTSSPTASPTTAAPTVAPIVPKPTTPSNNLAYGRVATQSSTCFDKPASRANDGDTDQSIISYTCLETNPWWEVDLTVSAAIDSVIVYNSKQYTNRLTNSMVQIVDEAGGVVVEKSVGKMQGEVSVMLDFEGAVGSKVRVQGPNQMYLTLAEVEVLGTPVPVRALRTKRSDPATVTAGPIKAKVDPTSSSSSVVSSKKHRNLATAEQFELSAARAKWAASAPPLSYDFGLERVDFLGPEEETGPFLVRVRSGVVDGVAYEETGEEVDLDLVDDVPFTVNGLFALIEEGLGKGAYEKVTYDPELGYPVEIYSLDEDDDNEDEDGFFDIVVSDFARALGAAGQPCEKKNECVSNKCLGSGMCAEEASV